MLLLVLEQENQPVNGLAQLPERRRVQRPKLVDDDAAHAKRLDQLGEQARVGLDGGPAA
jgi:hypothetical protein